MVEQISNYAAVANLILAIAIACLAKNYFQTLKKAKIEVRSLSEVYDIARSNNKEMHLATERAMQLNEISIKNNAQIGDALDCVFLELNALEKKRKEFEKLIKPIDRSRKKKLRGKRRK